MYTKIKIIVVIIFSICIVFSCNSKESNYFTCSSYSLKSNQIKIKSDIIGNPCRMLCHDSIVFFLDYYHKYNYTYLNLNDSTLFGHFGKVGKGPGEIKHGASIWIKNDIIGVYDISSKKIVNYRLEDIVSNNEEYIDEIYLKSLERTVYQVEQVTDSLYLCTGEFYPNRYIIYDSFLNKSTPFGSYPYSDELKMLEQAYPLTYQSDIIAFNDSVAISAADIHLGIEAVNVLEPEKYKWQRNYTKPKVKAEISDVYESVTALSSNNFGFIDITHDDKYIYALYSGRNSKKYLDQAKYSDCIVVYDINGNNVAVFNLDHDVKLIAIKNNKILALKEDPEFMLLEYSMEKISF